MKLDAPVQVHLDPQSVGASAQTSTPVPAPVETSEVPEASTWILLLVAAALWLLRTRRRGSARSRGF